MNPFEAAQGAVPKRAEADRPDGRLAGDGPGLRKVPRLWDVADLAAFLKKTSGSIYKMVERRQVPYVRFHRHIRFDPVAIMDWLRQHTVEPDQTRSIQY